MARYGLATVTELRGEYQRTAELLVPLVGAETGDLRVEACELLACSAFHQGDFGLSLEMAQAVLEAHEEGGYSTLMARLAEHPASAANSWGALSAWGLGRSAESLAMAQRAIDIGESHLYALSTALEQRALLHQLRNEPELCRQWADEAIQLAAEQGFPLRVMQATMHRAWADAVTGAPEEGADVIAETIRQFRAAGVRLGEPYFVSLEAEARFLAGDVDRALELVDQARRTMHETTRTFFYEPEIDRLEARLHVDAQRPGWLEAAREALDRALGTAERLGSPVLMLRALVDRVALESDHGDADQWRDLLASLLVQFDDQSDLPEMQLATELVAGR